MPSRLMRLSFPEEALDVYNLIKSKRSPSRFVIECVRFYQKNKHQRVESKPNEDLEVIVRKLVQKEIDSSENLLTPIISKILKEELSKVEVISRKDDVSENAEVSFGQPDLESLNFNAEVCFKGAADVFDDD